MVVLDLLVTMLVRFYIPYSTNFLFLLVLGDCVQLVHVAHPKDLEQTVLVGLLRAQFSAYLPHIVLHGLEGLLLALLHQPVHLYWPWQG